jgi:Cu-Zn family superoxide dismutase
MSPLPSGPSLRRGFALIVGPLLAVLFATAVTAGPEGPRHAHGRFIDASGAEIGSLHLAQDAHGIVHVNVQVQGLSTGLHGIHIHAVASCVAPTFASAGGHYNPLTHQHGLENPNGPHAGDLPNLTVDEDGHGRLQARTDRVTLTAGVTSLFDGDGSAFIIHANRDDQVTDAGNGGSGARIACAVVVADEPRPAG